ncbi:hypothetical protein OHR68_10240 [Spirillospora sp. NBC_00431]
MDSAFPVHQPGDIIARIDTTPRLEAWKSIPRRIRKELKRRSGTTIDWMAGVEPYDRPWAVVFGGKGLAALQPPDTPLFSFEFTPDSLDRVQVDTTPPSDTSEPSSTEDPPDIGLNDESCGLLGNLPGRAQWLVQRPFMAGQRIRSHFWQYEGTDKRVDWFMFYVAGARDVTVATGTMTVPPGGTAQWSVTCHHATVETTDAPPALSPEWLRGRPGGLRA